MSRVLIIAEHNGQQLNPATGKCVACALSFSPAQVDVAVFADQGADIAAQAAELSGVNQVLLVEESRNGQPLAAVVAPQVVAMASEYTHIFGPSTTFGKDLLPRVAGLLGVAQVSDVMTATGPHHFERPVYAGNAIAEVTLPEEMQVVATVRVASYKAVGNGGQAEVVSHSPGCEIPDHTRFVGLEAGGGDRPDLQTAARVVSGGRGVGSSDNFQLIYELADQLGAGVGASRAAVDAGFVANDLQVGQTGKIIAPDLYLAIGISGAIQHLTGIKDAGTIVAINKDADAPIFEVADIGLVADLFTAVPELTEAL